MKRNANWWFRFCIKCTRRRWYHWNEFFESNFAQRACWLLPKVNLCCIIQIIPSFSVKLRKAHLTLLCSCRDGNLTPHTAADHPWARSVHLLHAGHGLLLSQWGRGSSASYEGSNWRHPGGHHWSQRVRISPLHLWSSEITQVVFQRGSFLLICTTKMLYFNTTLYIILWH